MPEITQAEQDDQSAQVIQLVCFKLANEEYAVDITNVQEVIRVHTITPIPQTPPFVLGVINIRGNIVPVFDPRKAFHLTEKPFDEQTKIMVLDVFGTRFSMIVDEILDNIKIESSRIDPAPDVKLKIDREVIKGLGQGMGRMLIILDLNKVSDTLMTAIKRAAEAL